jgi:DNA polymerase
MTGSRDETLATLRWLVEAGADEAIEPQAIDRYARPASGAPRQTPAPQRQSRASAPPVWTPAATAPRTPDASIAAARKLAGEAQSLDELYAAIAAFEGCALKKSASNTVIWRGNPKAQVMLIGEAPGRDEDIQGKPFVGAAGRLLDEMLKWVGFDESNCYITNILFWRPPGNRSPDSREIATCLPFVERHIELLHPRYLMFLGGISAKSLLGQTRGITRLRGQWFAYQHAGLSAPIPAMAFLHTAYLLRQPAQKRLAWRDLLAFKEVVEQGRDPLKGEG